MAAAAKAAAARLRVELIKAELAAAEAEAEAAEQSPPPPPPPPPPGPPPTVFRGAGFNPVIPKPAFAPRSKEFLKNRGAVVHATETEAGEDTTKWATRYEVAQMLAEKAKKKEEASPSQALPKQKSQADIDKKAAKKARQRADKAAALDERKPDPASCVEGGSDSGAAALKDERKPDPASCVEGGSDSGGKDARKPNPASCVEGGSKSLPPAALQLVLAAKERAPPPAAASQGESSDNDSVDWGSEENRPKHPLNCCNSGMCGSTNLLWSQFLLVEGDADWQGMLWGVCLECSEMQPKAFKTLARRRKEERAQALRGKRDRARCINMANAKDILSKMFPGAPKQAIRELAIMRTKALASAFIMAYDKMTKQAKVATDQNCQEWLQRLEKAANDPSYACPVDARTLTATECSYLTNVAEGIQISFLCRNPKCMFFGMNDIDTWIPEIKPWGLSEHRFRCPRCGDEYWPTKESGGQIKASFCITTTCPETGVVSHIPTAWPPSNDMNWINNQIEIHARDMKSDEDLEAWFNRSKCDLAKFIRKQKVPLCFEKLPVGSDAIWRCQQSGKWHYEDIAARGYVMGSHFTSEDAAREPFSNFNELIGIFANHVAASRRFLSRM